MGTYESGKQNVRRLTKNSTGTYSVTLPIELVRDLHWQVGQKVVVKRDKDQLVVKDWTAQPQIR